MATTTDDADAAPARAGLREWLGLIVLVLPTVVLGLDLTVLYMAVPHLGADLGASNTELLWITDVYGFMVAGLLITMGTLGDRIGRRRLLMIGAAAFGAASALAAWSVSPEMLIASRALLGVAGATLMPSTLSLLRSMFGDPKQRSLAIGVWLIAFSIGGITGPAIGGLLLERFWWGSVFLLALPVMALLLATAPLLLPEHRSPRPGRLDPASVALSLGAILPFVHGVKEIAKDGPGAGALLAVALGVAVGLLFARRQRTLADPLLDLRLFARRRFTAALLALMLSMPLMYSFTFYFTQHLQLIAGLSPGEAGLWFLPLGAATVVASLAAPLLARRFRPASVIAAGMAVAACAFAALSLLDAGSGLALLIVGGVLVVVGLNPLGALGTDMIVGSAPADEAGSASAISETGNELGAAGGIAVGGSVGTAIYSARIEEAMPAGVPSDAAASAGDSFAAAFAVAEELPATVGAELLAAGRDAFLAGMNAVTALSAVAAVAIALLVLATLRQVPPIGR
ncbi:MFS transporter [Conexibacter arvalis]|uniref:DHA2 family multidrug resistance protein-like MFS transporter n=1 Tax=Conexibacter arvalis TaxID=912552 RepID=A0A840I916_9ACTN|nr:MFS transporter [Conexibacter arvalis]MBB4660634.1 DHA2 family multidrug resistance protein-like MFS transporter [Conexibacter arvalis]